MSSETCNNRGSAGASYSILSEDNCENSTQFLYFSLIFDKSKNGSVKRVERGLLFLLQERLQRTKGQQRDKNCSDFACSSSDDTLL